MIGRTISHYRVLEKLGEGGMGVVYRAVDTRLDRSVAIKILRPEAVGDPERKWRFVREAKAASALNHPNIVTIHDIDTAEGVDLITMEWVDGQSLDRLIGGRALPVDEALSYAFQTADALAAAHEEGIVHRDIKPANIMVTPAGRIKVLDFGLAKLVERGGAEQGAADSLSPTVTGEPRTRGGVILGTLAYMSPEQAAGKPVDARSDVFSFGSVLYEMLSGHRPFQADSLILTITAILRDAPAPLKSRRSDVPADVERILLRCLEKRPESRYPSAGELRKDLADVQARRTSPAPRLRSLLRRPRFGVPALLLLLAAAAGAAWLGMRGSRARWARDTALPEIARLVEKEDFFPAYRLARHAEPYLLGNREFQQLWHKLSFPCSVRTTPAGADVFIKDYMAADAAWEFLGKAPIEGARVPDTNLRWKIEKEGFDPMEVAPQGELSEATNLFQFTLTPKGSAPPGMVRVPGGQSRFGNAPAELRDYWIDKYEVTNRQFKVFVDRGAYQKREYWKHPFVKNGQLASWEEAMAEFRDATGRPGPATWELGTYPEGRDDYPVAGVSWYEAAAYAEFASKSLPTVHHWYKAADPGLFSDILRLSNFAGEGTARVGSHRGLGPYGTLDMAGNVKEWCVNEAGAARRYIMGGAWSDPSYVFGDPTFEEPFDRSASNGLRCAKHDAPLPEALTAPVETFSRNYSKEAPASDEIFRIYASLYAYDRTDLRPTIESVDETSEHWRRERITFNAAYGGERVVAYLFLPRNAVPPYQTVIYFPESPAEQFKSIDILGTRWFDFIIRSGRAFLYPIYKGTFERRTKVSGPGPFRPNVRRDQIIQWSKDLGRSIDYLETRKDIDSGRLAYYGFSLGAVVGPVLTAMEARLKASVWLGGGFPTRTLPPEIDAINFAPRVKVPVLMINGRQDFIRPVETSQAPLFRFLGTPERDKRHAILEGGHLPPTLQGIIKEVLDWLDRYLGPVKSRS
jgi:pimeloyl-ACP methyl ester carboxylesterase/predicted Ser/Thr protein kinase